MNTPVRTRGLTDLDPLPLLPHEAAERGWSALMLGLGIGPSLREDPHRVWKMNNFDRLLFDRMPVLCSGSEPLQVGRSWQMKAPTLAEIPSVMGGRK